MPEWNHCVPSIDRNKVCVYLPVTFSDMPIAFGAIHSGYINHFLEVEMLSMQLFRCFFVVGKRIKEIDTGIRNRKQQLSLFNIV